MRIIQLATAATLISLSTTGLATQDNWFVRPYVGLSHMSDPDADYSGIDTMSGDADVDLDTGFTAGVGLGYHYTDNFAVEVGWEYRSNDSEVTLDDTAKYDDGNYASNIFYLNGHYLFDKSGKWQPYIGAGLTWAEEIDIDLESGPGEDYSYSSDGDIGYQFFAGLNYDLNPDWRLQTELRYGRIDDIDLDGESGDPGEIEDIDYETTTLQVGLVYAF